MSRPKPVLPKIRVNDKGERCFIFQSRAHMLRYSSFIDNLPYDIREKFLHIQSFGEVKKH